MAQGRDRWIAALDVGTSKVSAIIAQVGPEGDIFVRGVGHQLCLGLNAGMVTNVDKTERAIRAAMDQAERSAGRDVEGVFVTINAASLASDIVTVDVDINGQEIEQADIDRVLAAGREAIDSGARSVLHAQPACYAIDGAMGVRNPIGLYGEKLAVDIHVVTAEPGPVKNLDVSVRRAHLNVAQVVAAPIATGYGCLTEEERNLGVALVELGAGVTNVAVFAGGMIVGCSTIMMGGADVTDDIARTLMTPKMHAERLKTLHGTVMATPSDNHEMVDVPPVSQEEGAEIIRISRAQLSGLIRERMELLFGEVSLRLDDLGFVGPSARQVVLTGGGSQLPGINHFAQAMLNKSVRIARPISLKALPEAASGPGFAALVGLVRYAVEAPNDARQFSNVERMELPRGRFARMARWIRGTW
jgi:cell division protein FtsA